MGYAPDRRPMENASRTSHRHLIQDKAVQDFLSHCATRVKPQDIDFNKYTILPYTELNENPITSFMAFDGGYQEIVTEPKHPSSAVCFFQMGALYFQMADLEMLENKAFIDPDDMAKLRQMQRFKLVLPLRNYVLSTENSITNTVRRALQNFFLLQPDDDAIKLLDTLHWLIFKEYRPSAQQSSTYALASCPTCRRPVEITRQNLNPTTRTMPCPHTECGHEIMLIDVFRLHEAIDDELGAGGIMGYVTTAIEQFLMIHFIKLVLDIKPSFLKELFFFKDGPLAFFGQTANMHKLMQDLISYLQASQAIYMVGLEKSGAFVEHAKDISSLLKPGHFLLLDNDYIYTYITPGRASDTDDPYASTSYYGQKIIFKTPEEAIYVITVPVPELVAFPKAENLKGLSVILTNVAKLRCDMYDNAIVPIALANKLVSLSNRPSARILQRFAQSATQ